MGDSARFVRYVPFMRNHGRRRSVRGEGTRAESTPLMEIRFVGSGRRACQHPWTALFGHTAGSGIGGAAGHTTVSSSQ